MVFLGAIKVRGHLDRHEFSQGALGFAGLLRQLLLLLGVYKNGRSVLRSRIPRVGRVMDPKEIVQELFIGPLVPVEGHPNGLGVVLDVPVGGVLVCRSVGVTRCASRVSNDRFDNALFSIVIALRAPKSSHGRLEGRVDVLGGRNERADLLGFGLLGGDHVVVVIVTLHAVVEADTVVVVVSVVVNCLFGNAGICVVSRRKRDRTKGLTSRNPHRCCQQSGG